jgi:hypothetical protein
VSVGSETDKTVFFQTGVGGFGGRKNISWTDHSSVEGDFEIWQIKVFSTTFSLLSTVPIQLQLLYSYNELPN